MDVPEAVPTDSRHRPFRYEFTSLLPCGDGEPMSESQLHGDALWSIFFQLQSLREIRNRTDDWYLIRDNFWYYDRTDTKRCCAPDIALIPGAERALDIRDSWIEWVEGGRRPTVIFEMASRSTVRDNLTAKKDLYESLGVKEYFVFDPSAEFKDPRLRGFRLVSGVYRELNLGARQRMLCRELDVWLQIEGEGENRDCRLIDRRNGERVLTRMERAEARVEEESARADQEAARAERQAARAEQQAARARQQAARADRESARADEMEARLAEANARMEAFRAAMRNAGIDPDSFPG